jgi:hypothetical protein
MGPCGNFQIPMPVALWDIVRLQVFWMLRYGILIVTTDRGATANDYSLDTFESFRCFSTEFWNLRIQLDKKFKKYFEYGTDSVCMLKSIVSISCNSRNKGLPYRTPNGPKRPFR